MSNDFESEMYVINKDNKREPICLKKIHEKIERLSFGLDLKYVDIEELVKKVLNGVYLGVKTTELDQLTAEIASTKIIKHPDYSKLAARIIVDNLHRATKTKILDIADELYNYHSITGKSRPLLSEETYQIIKKHHSRIDFEIDFKRDFEFTYFGLKTLEKTYLFRNETKTIERPQHMFMRVSIGIHGDDIERIIETYHLMSQRYFIHATPTLFNAGKKNQQLSSCFLLTVTEDTLEGVYETLNRCALISKTGAGIGLSIHNLRASGSFISGTNGTSNGIVPVLRVFDCTARYVDQGGNKRPGAFAIYLEPWHSDILDFLNLKKNTGKEELRARDLFYALWIPDLFMKRVEKNEEWTLMCPNEAPGLQDVWGKEFEELYEKYEKEGRGKKKYPAQKIWQEIVTSQIETGTPYILYKDSCNRKSNQQNLGTIKCSNLCTEIIQYVSKDEIAVCNLASIGLPMFVTDSKTFNFKLLHSITKKIAFNLNRIIDRNFYPLEEAKTSNLKHRPLGIGVQGLADVFMMMGLSFGSEKAHNLNTEIFETIYHAALSMSCELAESEGVYPSYQNSPISKGLLQCDLWNVNPPNTETNDWDNLRKKIAKYGVRNSLLVAPMPTASTSQILGFNETTEPYQSNIYIRRVLSGEFQIVNRHLVKELCELNLWNDTIRTQLIADNGSLQRIACIPQKIKDIYRTTWEISQKTIINMAVKRAPYIDQSQSLNIHLPEPTYTKLTSMHFYGWKAGLKTGMYYLRTKPASEAIKFTIDQEQLSSIRKKENVESVLLTEQKQCKIDDPFCFNCGS